MKNLALFSYFRSTAAYRVRIALNIKGISFDQIPVNLFTGEQSQMSYVAKNPQGLVPAIETEQGVLGQSLAILEWLEQIYPENTLLPGDAWQQAQIRSISYAIACDIHPLNNLRVLKYLESELGQNAEQKKQWYQHWLAEGFGKIESMLTATKYCVGEQLSMADCCLIPQIYNAHRFEFDMTGYPKISAVERTCLALTAFERAHPENQPDAS